MSPVGAHPVRDRDIPTRDLALVARTLSGETCTLG